MVKRTDKINSLLKEVISEVIQKKLRNPSIKTSLITVSRVEITKDLKFAKVYLSIIGDENEKKTIMKAIQKASGFIGVNAANKIILRFFPKLSFYIDDTVEKQMRINDVLKQINTDS